MLFWRLTKILGSRVLVNFGLIKWLQSQKWLWPSEACVKKACWGLKLHGNKPSSMSIDVVSWVATSREEYKRKREVVTAFSLILFALSLPPNWPQPYTLNKCFSDPAACATAIVNKTNGDCACGFVLWEVLTWAQAFEKCKQRKARLPEINSEQENQDLFALKVMMFSLCIVKLLS